MQKGILNIKNHNIKSKAFFYFSSFNNLLLHLLLPLLHPSSHQLPQRRLIDLASPFHAQDEIISDCGELEGRRVQRDEGERKKNERKEEGKNCN